MLVEYINIKRRHTLPDTQIPNLHLSANYLTVLEAPPPGLAWLVRRVLTCQTNGPNNPVSGGDFRVRYAGSTEDIITPVAASKITTTGHRCFPLLPLSHELQFNTAVQLSASSGLTQPRDPLEIIVIADLVRQ